MSWDDGFVDEQARRALQQIQNETQRLSQQSQQLAERVQRADERDIYSALDQSELGPIWRDLNQSPEFLAWLASCGASTGYPLIDRGD
jgi:hypothetical protein